MSITRQSRIIELPINDSRAENPVEKPLRAVLLSISEDGSLLVTTPDGQEFLCDFLESSGNNGIRLEPGDRLLCMPPQGNEPGVVLGRIGRYQEPKAEANLTIEASESLTLKCGESSLQLLADGLSMLKGEDVLLRAKRTQRIRAASVAIN